MKYVVENEGDGWMAYIPEYEGCLVQGESPEDAFQKLLTAKTTWEEGFSDGVSDAEKENPAQIEWCPVKDCVAMKDHIGDCVLIPGSQDRKPVK